MSKNLRVFLLSVLVVVLGVTSAFAGETLTFTSESTDVKWTGASLDKIVLDSSTAGKTLKLTLTGTQEIWLSSKDLFSFGGNGAALTITREGTGVYFVVDSIDWNISNDAVVSIDVPFKLSGDNTTNAFRFTVEDATLAFTDKAVVYDDNGNKSKFSKVSFDIKGTLSLADTATFGTSVVSLDEGTLKFAADGLNDLTISVSGDSKLYVDKDLSLKKGTVTGEGSNPVLGKFGTATLTLVSIDQAIKGVTVYEGKAVVSANALISGDKITFTVSNDAELELAANAVNSAKVTKVSFDVQGTGKVTLAEKAISQAGELYPHDEYTEAQRLNILTSGVFLSVDKDATVTINGMQAVAGLSGSGSLVLTGEGTAEDSKLLLLVSDEVSTFSGTITGNVGICSGDFEASQFASADLQLDNLIVYGGSTLHITSADSDIFANVANIWLRSDTSCGDGDKTLAGTVGALSLDQGVEVSGIKVDATTNADGVAVIEGASADVVIAKVTLYANTVDFDGSYPTSSGTLHALMLGGNLVWDGTDTEGTISVSSDIVIADSSDIELKGTNPIGSGTDLIVGAGTYLTVENGATLGGNVEFAAGKTAATETLALASFDADATSHDYTVFKTTVAKGNRIGNGDTNAVIVSGKITLPTTKYAVGFIAGVGSDAFEGVDDTFGARFMVLGSTTEDMAGSYFLFVPTTGIKFVPNTTLAASKKGVVIESQTSALMTSISSSDYTLTSADSGTNKTFEVQIPYTLKYTGKDVYTPVTSNVRTANTSDGTVVLNGIGNLVVTLGTESDDTGSANFSTEEAMIRTSVSYATTAATIGTNQYITLAGTLYNVADHPELKLKVFFDWEGTSADVDVAEIVPVTFTFKFGEKAASEDVSEDVDFSENMDSDFETLDFVAGSGDLVFKVKGMHKKPDTETSTASLVNGVYKWRVSVVEGTYVMTDSEGNEVEVDNIVLRIYAADGTYTEVTDLTIEPDPDDPSNSVIVTVPVSALGDTGGQASVIKELSVVGTASDGTVIATAPQSITLHAKAASGEYEAESLNQNVALGTPSTDEVIYEISEDIISGEINFSYNYVFNDNTATELPEWLGWTGGGNVLSYKIDPTKLTDADVGTHTFKVMAYNGELTADTSYVTFTFTVTVEAGDTPGPAPTPAISGDSSVSVNFGQTATATLSLLGGATSFDVAENTNPEGLLTFAVAGETVTLTIDATVAGLAATTYNYTFTADAEDGEVADFPFAVTVVSEDEPGPGPEPGEEFEIVVAYDDDENEINGFEDSPLLANHTYYAIFEAAGVPAGEVTWALADENPDEEETFPHNAEVYSTKSGDKFVVEGTLTTVAEGQGFVVTATYNGTTKYYSVPFDVEADEQEYTDIAEVSGTEVTGSHTAVAEGYKVMFPEGVTADPSDVFLPSWLKPVLNEDGEVIGVEFAGVVGNLANGTAARVHVTGTDADGEDVYYSWDVTYASQPDPMEFSVAPEELNLQINTTGTVTLTATNLVGEVTYTASVEWVTFSGNIATFTAPAASGDYTVTITATDDRGAEGAKTATVTVHVTEEAPVPPTTDKFEVTASPTTLNLETGETGTVTLTTEHALGNVTYTASETWVTVDNATGVATFAPTAAGTYTVTITASDAGRTTENTATATVTVTVTEPIVPEFSITTRFSSRSFSIVNSPVILSVDAVVRAENNVGTVTYAATVSPDEGLVVAVDNEEGSFTLVATKVGTYTVTITGTDLATNDTDTATITVTVTGGGVGGSSGGCDAGFGALALALATPLFLRRRRS